MTSNSELASPRQECLSRWTQCDEKRHQQELIIQRMQQTFDSLHPVIDEFKVNLEKLDERIRNAEVRFAQMDAIAQLKARKAGLFGGIVGALISLAMSITAGIILYLSTR